MKNSKFNVLLTRLGKDLTNQNNTMEGSAQNFKKMLPDEVQLTEDTVTLLKKLTAIQLWLIVTTLSFNNLGKSDAENQNS